MQHRIVGTTMPVLEFALDHNDAVISEAGELSWMSQSRYVSIPFGLVPSGRPAASICNSPISIRICSRSRPSLALIDRALITPGS